MVVLIDESGRDPFTGNWYAAERVEGGNTNVVMVTVTVKPDADLTSMDYSHAEILVARALNKIKEAIEQ